MSDTPKTKHSRAGLFTPFILLLIVAVGWTGWWFYLADQVKTRFEAQIDGLRTAGWDVAYTKLSMNGWPFRLRTQIDHVAFNAPSGHGVAGPKLVAQASAWNPDKWVLIAPDGLTVTRAGKGKVAVRGAGLRMSVSGLTQRWPNVVVELAQPEFTILPGAEPFPISRAKLIQFYLRPHLAPAGTPGVETSVDMLFRLVDAEGRPNGPVEGMTRNGMLSAQIETVVERADQLTGADAAGIFGAWTRAGGRFIDIQGELQAGDSRARLSSAVLSAQPDGRLQGQLALQAEKPLPAIAGLAQSGSGAVNQAGAMGAAAATAVAGGAGDNIDLTLVFKDGRTFLGPFALAPAPKLF